jgi:hypothetical protein
MSRISRDRLEGHVEVDRRGAGFDPAMPTKIAGLFAGDAVLARGQFGAAAT